MSIPLDGSQVTLIVAFVAGFVTFFASCLLPLVPTYIAYLSGVSLSHTTTTHYHWRILKTSFSFVLGFISTFMVIGLSLNHAVGSLLVFRGLIEKVAGVFFIIIGIALLDIDGNFFITNIPWLKQEKRLDIVGWLHRPEQQRLHAWFEQHLLLQAFLIGIGFGLGWTPCVGPVLAVIFFWSAQATSFMQSFWLLLAYGVGLAIPFLLVGLLFEQIMPFLKRNKAISNWATLISASLVIVAGLLLLAGQFQKLSFFLLEIFNLPTLAK